jgi:uncharacterized protein YbjT (DUF2867 family)
MARKVFISGGTGYVGRALVERLVASGHDVRVLARGGSEGKVAPGAELVRGNALHAATFAQHVGACDTYVHLTGVSHPAPWKGRAFRAVDLASLRASATAAKKGGIAHFIYVSVAQPAPVMKAYIRVRQECEGILADERLVATILRPWYVVGPGHWWPVALIPVYKVLESIGSTRAAAQRLGLVKLDEMTAALRWAVENPATETRVLDVPLIRDLAIF